MVTVAALALAVIGGCTNDTAGSSAATTTVSTTPTPTTTVDPNDPQAVAYAEAEAAYREYFDLSQEIRQRPGMEGWSDLRDFLIGEDVLVPWQTWYTSVTADPEYHQNGESKLVSVRPLSYTPPAETYSTGSREVVLEVCTDNSGSDIASIESEVMAYRPPLPERILVGYTMTGVPLYPGSESEFMAESWDWWKGSDPVIAWMVSGVEIREGETC